MLTYTTHLKKLILPEYGRNIQRMVDHCLTIEDRAERTRCAATIVKTMEQLFPVQGNADAYRRKLWDHLAIMSDFALDVDVPFELVGRGSLDDRPEPLNYDQAVFEHRHYGLLLQRTILRAAEMEEGEERDELVMLLANHMKKIMLAINPEVSTTRRYSRISEYCRAARSISIRRRSSCLNSKWLPRLPAKRKRKNDR